jgi:hypothetical protein
VIKTQSSNDNFVSSGANKILDQLYVVYKHRGLLTDQALEDLTMYLRRQREGGDDVGAVVASSRDDNNVETMPESSEPYQHASSRDDDIKAMPRAQIRTRGLHTHAKRWDIDPFLSLAHPTCGIKKHLHVTRTLLCRKREDEQSNLRALTHQVKEITR